MKIAIRKELNGLIYIDKNAINRFDEETLKRGIHLLTYKIGLKCT